jgi:hypothetical protein
MFRDEADVRSFLSAQLGALEVEIEALRVERHQARAAGQRMTVTLDRKIEVRAAKAYGYADALNALNEIVGAEAWDRTFGETHDA